VFQAGRERLLVLEQLPAGAHRVGPWRSLFALATQIHHPLQRAPVRGSSLPLVPVHKPLLLQLRSELDAGADGWASSGEAEKRSLTTGVTMTHSQPRRHVGLLPSALPGGLGFIYVGRRLANSLAKAVSWLRESRPEMRRPQTVSV
jgi:hypothetical protein